MFDTLFTGKNFIKLAEAASTNSYAMQLLASNPVDGTLISATSQLAGRGQSGNHWESESGKNLTISLIYYPRFLKIRDIFYLSKLISLGLQDSIARMLPGQTVQIKWPNDILVNQQKIAGILIENQLEGSDIRVSVSGIGLNVNQRDFSPIIASRTCSLRHFQEKDLDLMEVLGSVLKEIEVQYLHLKNGKFAQLDRAYLQHLFGYQEEMTFRVDQQLVQGIIIGVGKQGHLAVDLAGSVRHFEIKEIEFVYGQQKR